MRSSIRRSTPAIGDWTHGIPAAWIATRRLKSALISIAPPPTVPRGASRRHSATSRSATTTTTTTRARRTSSSPTSAPRRSTPTSSACTRRGSASTISIRSACSPARTSCSPTSRRGRKRIRLAPAVTVLPLHHPIRVAEQWATLDLLSNGRVDFAAGRGYDRREYQPFGVSFEDNQGIFEEGLEVVRRLWAADGRISHHGRHYSLRRRARSRRSRCSGRSRPTSHRSRSPRSSSRRGSAAG